MKRNKISSPITLLQEMEVLTTAKRLAMARGQEYASAGNASFKTAEMHEQLLYSRAVEAVIWGMPVVNYDMMHQAFVRDAGGSMNEIVYWSRPGDWRNQTLTPDPDVICIAPFFDMKEAGPMVLHIPSAEGENGIIVGHINDCWQNVLADVGPEGLDKGRGGDYLIMPPGYRDNIPDGYIPVLSNYYQGYALLSSVLKSCNDADIEKAVDYAKQIKLYPLSTSDAPSPTILLDAYHVVFDSTIPYDLRFFESLSRMVQHEPWVSPDKVMINILKSIGIEKNWTFKPTLHTEEILDAAARAAQEWLSTNLETSFPQFHKERQWRIITSPEIAEGAMSESNDRYPVDQRGVIYHCAFSAGKHQSRGLVCLVILKDKHGESFEGANHYRLHIPAHPHANPYWSIVVYDRVTHTFIRNVSHAARSSQTPGLKYNRDGSVDIYFGPDARAGGEPNWIPTVGKCNYEVCFRFYGTEKPMGGEEWKPGDVERIVDSR